ncbi:MAG TPA: sigma-70 family RNA polymerase sigma factor [Asticcacaulis sp.]|nr:sigma-70 family RNA polymerase sigma factor [Asticcacaulis sp.]
MSPDKGSLQSPESRRALEDINARYRDVVRRYFLKRIGNHAEAEDLTQDLMVRLAQRLAQNPIENPEAFLFTTAANLLRDRGRRQRTASRFLADMAASRSENFEALSPERVLVSKQSLRAILEAQAELDPRVRDVFILHRLEGMKYADIAKLYGLSVSSIEKDIIKALAHLARQSAKLEE